MNLTRDELRHLSKTNPAFAHALEAAERDDEKALRNRLGATKSPGPDRETAPKGHLPKIYISATAQDAPLSRDDARQHASETENDSIPRKADPQPEIRQIRQMNKTEARFAALLDARKARGELVSWRYEAIRLKWGGCMNYLPDFLIFGQIGALKPVVAEVKGSHVYDRDLVRFKGCRHEWPEFQFELHQWKNGTWKRLH